MTNEKTKRKQRSTLEVKQLFNPNKQAMLQALRVVLGMPKKPITLKDIDGTENENLAIYGK